MKKIIKLEGLCCANCAAKIEEGVKKLDGVNNASLIHDPASHHGSGGRKRR